MDIFTWSIPFVVEKVSDMFVTLLKSTNEENLSDEEDEEEEHPAAAVGKKPIIIPSGDAKGLSEKGNKLRGKIKFVARMAKLQRVLR